MSRQERQTFWQQQVAEWGATDLSAAAFCRQRSLTYHQFIYWRQQLSDSTSTGSEGSAVPGTTGFSRVTQVEQSISSELSVILPGGIRIAGLHAGNVNLLDAILGQL